MKFTFKGIHHQNFDDSWEDTPEKQSLAPPPFSIYCSPLHTVCQ